VYSAREYTMFALAQLLRNWREVRPRNQAILIITGEVWRVCYTGVDLLLVLSLFVVRDCFCVTI
jgi:hypothetical protein